MSLKILHYPHPILKQIAKPVVTFDEALKQNLEDMIALMYEDNAVGLAANQVGLPSRFFVMDTLETQNEPLCLINPEIIEKEGEGISEEGCMSLPGIYLKIPRAAKITIKYQNAKGEFQSLIAEGLAAFCIQHELEHLNGILSIDHLSKLKRSLYIKKMQKMKRHATEEE